MGDKQQNQPKKPYSYEVQGVNLSSVSESRLITVEEKVKHLREIIDQKEQALNDRVKILETNKVAKDTQFFQLKVFVVQIIIGVLSFIVGNFFPIISNHIK